MNPTASMSEIFEDPIVNAAFKLAAETLKDLGSFQPFGVAQHANGEISYIYACDTLEEVPEATESMRMLQRIFCIQAESGEFAGVAFVADAKVEYNGEKTDAILIKIERLGSEPIDYHVTYKLDSEANLLRVGDSLVNPGGRCVF